MNIVYACDFDLSRDEGKERATNQKIHALRKKCKSLKVFDMSGKSQSGRLLWLFLFELKVCFYVFNHRPEYIISRGYCGFIFQRFAKYLGIKTVREIHADILGESSLLSYKGGVAFLIKQLAKISNSVDCSASCRIFNHPDLLSWFSKNRVKSENDFFVYNGYDANSSSKITKEQAKKLFNLDSNITHLVFVGAASQWHGVDYLVELQREFNKNADNILIVCGGGDLKNYDKDSLCLNITPLDALGCSNLIKAGDYCLLPVRNNRVSPGSPLKLYDYMINKKIIFAQKNTLGYSDEVERYQVGLSIDFSNASEARETIVSYMDADISANKKDHYPKNSCSWDDRTDQWVEGLRKI